MTHLAGNGASGRRPQPTAIRALRGNPGKRAMPKAEPQLEPKRPPCPRWLNAEAKDEWGRIVPVLLDIGVLSRIDRTALAAYCQSWARYRQAEETIEHEGSTYAVRAVVNLKDGTDEVITLKIVPHPAVAISQRERQSMKAYLIEFGLTPASRTRLKAPERQPVDPFAEFGRV